MADKLPYDLESSFYGPETIWCWYLTLVSVLITWLLHPSAKFSKLETTFDLIIFALYPCFAAGHMAYQTSLFDPKYIPSVLRYWEVGPMARNLDSFKLLERDAISVLDASLRVCQTYLFIGTFALYAVRAVQNPEVRPRRRRLLPWVLFASEIWVLSCVLYLAVRCGFMRTTKALAKGCLWYVLWVIVSIMMVFFEGFMCYIPPAFVFECWKAKWDVFLAVNAVIIWPGVFWVFYIVLTCLLHPAMWFMVSGVYFADVGVKITALDQLFPLGSGIVVVIFNGYNVWRERRGIKKAHSGTAEEGTASGRAAYQFVARDHHLYVN